MEAIFTRMDQLIDQAIQAALINERDRVYCRNQILGMLNMDFFIESNQDQTNKSIPGLLNDILEYAIENEVIADVLDEKEVFCANIMNCFLSKPSEISDKFYQLYQKGPEEATNYFYQLSKDSNYIQTERIAKNIHYQTTTKYGDLDITINLSKPEKDPEQIKRERQMKQTINYPKCLLCAENEGYVGRTGHPARSNHRIIGLELADEDWFFQYSPYVYYNEHSIVFSKEHRPMTITKGTFERLTSFVEQFPHYFVGSNADLPIVGGSILSHDHYQAGNYTFAMTKAEDEFTFDLEQYPDIQAAVVRWPMSVIRLRSENRTSLVDAADLILKNWRAYSDSSVDILAYTEDTPHNTITPIARMRDGNFELDLVLRNNRTSEKHPDGIFHPHQDVHHIKKENIGLIEVMGLAVLPPRLKEELEAVQAFLVDGKTNVEEYHQVWANDIKHKYKDITKTNVESIVHDELGKKFVTVLEDSGVFKSNSRGKAAFKRFLLSLK